MEVFWSDRALDDLLRVPNLYVGRDPDLAGRAISRILGTADLIVRYPQVGSVFKGTRRRRVGWAPFFVFFREVSDRIEIVRVLHLRSDWSSLV